MSSTVEVEEQPLLSSSIDNDTNWDDKGTAYPEVHIPIDSCRNGLNRRDNKANDCHASDEEENSPVNISITLPAPQRKERFPSEKIKTCVAFLFLCVSMAWTLTVLAIVHERLPDRSKYPPLPDIFFDVFPPVEWALDASEFIIIASVWSTVVLIILHKHRFIIFRRCFIIIGVLYFMRSITMLVTQVPVASETYFCSPKAKDITPSLISWRVLYLMSGFGLSVNGHHTYCGDYIYSGHTVILTMVYLVVREYSPKKLVIMHWLVFCTSSVGVFFVLLSRGHYTVDVIIGYYATTRVFWIYHTIANNLSLKSPGNHNFISRVWWFRLFMYFEQNVNGVVPQKFEWPFCWPRIFNRHTRIS